jgi:hypothetical protein
MAKSHDTPEQRRCKRMTEEISQLEYNKRFIDRLKTRRPDLLDQVEMVTHKGVEYVKIQILPPAGQEDTIGISTYGQELTMFYHAHHAHFDMFADGDEEEEFDEFFDYIDAFLKEELVAISEFDGEKWCGAHDARAAEPVEPKENRQVIVKSWKGTYSRTIE